VEPPFLLVGHSYGGALVRVFAARYPAEVLGIVLVDPTQEDFYLRAAREAPAAYLAQLEEDLRSAESSGSAEFRRELLGYETSMAQARVARLPMGRPVVLLSATRMELAPELRRIWLEEQGRWATAVGARRVLVEHGHRIPQERPGAVVEAVGALLRDERVRCRLTDRCS
jgi:pimeloyl-ACP methyl ester carboxylesterase